MITPEQMLDDARGIMQKKSEDYTTHSRFENFDRCALIAGWFLRDTDKVYATFIAVKLARLASLLGRKDPNNEAIEDTFKDMINYAAIWGSDVSNEED